MNLSTYLLLLLLPLLYILADPLPAIFSSPSLPSLPHRILSPSASQQLLSQPSSTPEPPEGWYDLELLDTVLVGTIDGGLHALERSTGRRLWSRVVVGEGRGVVRVGPDMMGAASGDRGVREAGKEGDGDEEQEEEGEEHPEYIVDPYDGQLYTHSSSSANHGQLQKLPLTMEQLIDLSPFSFPPHHTHLFLGSRTTSLLSLDLQTGESAGGFGCATGVDEGFTVVPGTGEGGLGEEEEEREEREEKERRRRERCMRDIGERPEDRLFIGQTDYHLSIHASGANSDPSNLPLQQIHYSKLGPNQAYRELAAYWKKHGNVRGEVYRSSRGRTTPTASSSAVGDLLDPEAVGVEQEEQGEQRRFKTEVEMDERWRVEMTFDGTIIGLEVGRGHRWYTKLGSVAIAVYDILLPTSPSSNPILLPQPPAHLPTLFPQQSLNLQLLSLPASTYLSPLPPTSLSGKLSAGGRRLPVFAMGSANYPLILLAPRVQGGGIVGGYQVVESVEERLPLLLDQGKEGSDEAEALAPIPVEDAPERGVAWWVWALVGGAVFFLLLGLSWFKLGRKGSLANGGYEAIPVETEMPVLSEKEVPEINMNGKEMMAEKSLPPIPTAEDPIASTSNTNHSDEAMPESSTSQSGKKPNGRRRKRGKKKDKSEKGESGDEDGDGEIDAERDKDGEREKEESWEIVKDLGEKVETPPVEVVIEPEHVVSRMEGLTVSDEVIGLGSHGTVVYKGVFQGRAVAVKRLLQDFVTVASQEVALLQASDDHQNVIRYFCQEKRDNFLYIALELCPASLGDIIESPDCHQELAVNFNAKRALFQVTSGLRYLHGLKIIHRDIKPQNVLVSVNKNGSQRMLLSDFGLAKRLDHGQSSYVQTGKHAIGSIGWRAPECLRGEVHLDELFEGSTPSGSSSQGGGGGDGSGSTGKRLPGGARLTKAVDLFALGCLYFYVLTSGGHPYGDRYEREINIMRDEKVGMVRLEGFEGQTEGEAGEIVKRLLSPVSVDRPDTTICLTHPLFWTPGRRLAFLCDASDRFEIMELQPPEPTLVLLESKSIAVVGSNWHKRLDSVFLENLGKHRKYDSKSVRDLLRALRNKKHHYQDLPENVKRRLGPLPAGFLHYFTSRFPALFMHVHDVVYHSRLKNESMFVSYFEVDE